MRERENLDDLPPLGEPDEDGRWAPPPDHGEPRKDRSAGAEREIPLHWHRDADPDAERAWLVRNTIGEVGKGLLAGQWGTYKTFIVLDLSGAVMLGGSFAGRKVTRQGGVLFIAPEGAFEVPIRLRGLVEGKLRGSAIAGAITGAAGLPDLADLPFAWIEECPRLVTDGAAEALIRVAERASAEMLNRYGVPLALVVVDTVAAGAGFDDENSAAETQKVMNVLEQLAQRVQAFVLGVDHFGKSVETGTRGSSAKEAAADTVLAALGTKDEAGNVSNTRLAVRKVRGARTGQEIPYDVEVITIGEDRWGDPITTCIVNWQTERQDGPSAAAPASKWPVALKVFRAALTNTLAGQDKGKRIRPFGGEGPEVLAATDKAVRAEFCAAYPADGETNEQRNDAKGKAFKRARTQALGKGLIAAREVGGVDPPPMKWSALWYGFEPGGRIDVEEA
ncbi:AAA family ATPase, partial [Methylobacterium organophilum]|uniref:ATP-binding protein n=1 Tax=Methylobacterium organophilum TaxID=410 RepID=UPI0019CFDEB6